MARPHKTSTVTPGIVGYVRVSTDEQVVSGLGMAAQRQAIEAEALRRGLPLLAVHTDAGISGKSLARPGLTDALADLDAGRGSVLLVAKLDRLSRSVHDATGLLLRAEKAGWGIVAMDANVDTTTPQGAAMTQVLAVFAELERRLIGQRTRDALAVKKAQGVKLGRPRTLDPAIVARIRGAHDAGQGWSTIARDLTAEGVPTAQSGARWYPATVRYVYLADEPAGATA